MNNVGAVVGSGPHKVLALHGWFGSARGWGGLPEWLDGDRFTYVFMDCRGYGSARDLPGVYSLAEIAGDVLATADRLHWDRFSLIGHSMGGAAMQHVLAQASARVQAMVGITPVPASGVPFDEAAWALFSSAASDPQARRAILDFSTGGRLGARWVEHMLQHSLAQSRVQAFAAYLPAWARTDISARIAGATLPVQLIVGEHDAGLTEDLVRATWMRWYPNAELLSLRNAGHYPMFETPPALAASIERFLSAQRR